MSNPLKVLFFDIENITRPELLFHPGKRSKFGGRQAGFCTDLAYVLVFGYQWLGDDKPQAIHATADEFYEDPLTDDHILTKIYHVLSEADVIVTYYGAKHDYPFLLARLARAGQYLDPSIKHVDVFNYVSRKLNLSSSSLDSAAKFFGLESKTKVSHKLWVDCWSGKYESLVEMADYCKQDVTVLKNVYHKMTPLMPAIHRPVVDKSASDGRECGTCGEHALRRKGRRITKTRIYQRLVCTKCGTNCIGEVFKG